VPEVGGHQTVRVRGVACAIFVSLVEGQKPGRFPFQPGAELHLLIIDGEVIPESLFSGDPTDIKGNGKS